MTAKSDDTQVEAPLNSNDSIPAGLLMLAMAALAIFWANSHWAPLYHELSQLPTALRIGALVVEKPLVLFVNDGLMAVFFLLVGVEIKRELAHGSLANPRQAALPALAALGGMLVPALIYVAFNHADPEAVHGWAIPCATDIAFSLVVLRLAAPRGAAALIIFLTAVAVIDDLGAIIVIAVFYTEHLSPAMLGAAVVPLLALFLLNRAKVRSAGPYLLAGLVLWFCVLKSGVHATLAGVITAMALPVSRLRRDAPADNVEHALQPWVAYAVLPLFALLNAGIDLSAIDLSAALGPVPLGVAIGLLVGKTVGVALGAWACTRFAGSRLPAGVTWPQVIAVSMIAGIGFTMSIFIASLAFEGAGAHHFNEAKLGIVAGSLASALIGTVILRRVLRDRGTP